jgi:hypothetical protein
VLKLNSSKPAMQPGRGHTGAGLPPIQVVIFVGQIAVWDKKKAIRLAINALKNGDVCIESTDKLVNPQSNACLVCGWIHDTEFTQIKIGENKVITLGGVLPYIVAAVHRAHEKGLALSTKDKALQAICGSYKHPAKAFDDLNHSADYKILFNRRRGFISLRGALRKDSESDSETKPE